MSPCHCAGRHSLHTITFSSPHSTPTPLPLVKQIPPLTSATHTITSLHPPMSQPLFYPSTSPLSDARCSFLGALGVDLSERFLSQPTFTTPRCNELIGLESPTERHEVISAVRVRRLPPALLNRPVQPPSVAEATKSSIATTRTRSIVRSPSQPKLPIISPRS